MARTGPDTRGGHEAAGARRWRRSAPTSSPSNANPPADVSRYPDAPPDPAQQPGDHQGNVHKATRTYGHIEGEVLGGEEEGRTAFVGATSLVEGESPYLVLDIGGGSTEFILGDP